MTRNTIIIFIRSFRHALLWEVVAGDIVTKSRSQNSIRSRMTLGDWEGALCRAPKAELSTLFIFLLLQWARWGSCWLELILPFPFSPTSVRFLLINTYTCISAMNEAKCALCAAVYGFRTYSSWFRAVKFASFIRSEAWLKKHVVMIE